MMPLTQGINQDAVCALASYSQELEKQTLTNSW